MVEQDQTWILLDNFKDFLSMAFTPPDQMNMLIIFENDPDGPKASIDALEDLGRLTVYDMWKTVKTELLISQGTDVALLPCIYKAAKNVVDSMTAIHTTSRLLVRSPSSTVQSKWPDMPGGREGLTLRQVVESCVQGDDISSMDLEASRAALVALRIAAGQVKELEDKCASLFKNSEQPGTWSISQIQQKSEEARRPGPRQVFRDAWRPANKVFDKSFDQWDPYVDAAARLQLRAMQRLHSSYMNTLKSMRYIKAALSIFAKEMTTLLESIRLVRSSTYGLQASLMAGDTWSLKIAYREWESSLVIFGKAFAAAMKPNLSHIMDVEYARERQAAVKTNFTEPKFRSPLAPLPSSDHVVIAAGICALVGNGSTFSTSEQFTAMVMPEAGGQSPYCTGRSDGQLRRAAASSLAIPARDTKYVQQGHLDHSRFSSSNYDYHLLFTAMVKFAQPFAGTVPNVKCWITKFGINKKRHLEYVLDDAFIYTEVEEVRKDGFVVKVHVSIDGDKPIPEQTFTISWIAIDTEQFPRPVFADLTHRVGTRENRRFRGWEVQFPAGLFSEPPIVFCAISGFKLVRMHDFWMEVSCSTQYVTADGCWIDADGNMGYEAVRYTSSTPAIEVTVIAVGQERLNL